MDGRQSYRRSGEIDALRALAMLAVIAQHAHLLPMGWIGVWLFYVISGFVVTQSVLRRMDETQGAAQLGSFFRRRAARIVPVYYAYLVIGLAVAALVGLREQGIGIASLFLFFNNVAMAAGIGAIQKWPTGHLWTISVEMQFYLVYGVALCLLPRRATKTLLCAMLVACPLARLGLGLWLDAANVQPLDKAFTLYVAPGLHFDIFAMGALLAFLKAEGDLKRHVPTLAAGGVALFGLYVVAYASVNMLIHGRHGLDIVRDLISGVLAGDYREVFVYSAIGAAMTGLVAVAAGRKALVRPVLGFRPLQWIGEISYGGYVFHQIGLMTATMLLGLADIQVRNGGLSASVMQFAIGTTLTLALAAASFRWFETPCRKWIEGAGRRSSAPTRLTPSQAEAR